MSIGGVTGPYYVPVTPVASVQASSRTPERRADKDSESADARRAPPPPARTSRTPPEQGRLFDIKA